DRELEFLVQTGAVGKSPEAGNRLRHIATCQNIYTCPVEGHDAGISIFKFSFGVDVHATGKRVDPLLAQSLALIPNRLLLPVNPSRKFWSLWFYGIHPL